jgi:metal-responsive CopG/Arc/MetJ family transcriptional regulator
MTFSIHLDDDLAKRLKRRASKLGKARNALIREALEDWLARNQPARWPRSITDFKGVRHAPRFEESRKEFQPRLRMI